MSGLNSNGDWYDSELPEDLREELEGPDYLVFGDKLLSGEEDPSVPVVDNPPVFHLSR